MQRPDKRGSESRSPSLRDDKKSVSNHGKYMRRYSVDSQTILDTFDAPLEYL
jgi:hypothetical protein